VSTQHGSRPTDHGPRTPEHGPRPTAHGSRAKEHGREWPRNNRFPRSRRIRERNGVSLAR
jgi:hypothetical protein